MKSAIRRRLLRRGRRHRRCRAAMVRLRPTLRPDSRPRHRRVTSSPAATRGGRPWPRGQRGGFAHLERLAVDVLPVEGGNGRLPLLGGAVLDEAEAFRRAAAELAGDVGGVGLAEGECELAQLRIGDLLGQVADVNFHIAWWREPEWRQRYCAVTLARKPRMVPSCRGSFRVPSVLLN